MTWDERYSCRLNFLLGGDACETFCSRVWVCSLDNWKGCAIKCIIDSLFFWETDHCWKAHLRHIKRSLEKSHADSLSTLRTDHL